MTERQEVFTINSLAEETGLTPVYIRRAILEGKLESSKVQISEDSKVTRHEITWEAYEEWRAKTVSRSRREDNRNKFILYATPDELVGIRAHLKESKSGAVVQKPRQYKPKSSKS